MVQARSLPPGPRGADHPVCLPEEGQGEVCPDLPSPSDHVGSVLVWQLQGGWTGSVLFLGILWNWRELGLDSRLATMAGTMASVLSSLRGHSTQALEPVSICVGAFRASVDSGPSRPGASPHPPRGPDWGGGGAGHPGSGPAALRLSLPPLGRCPAPPSRTVLRRCLFSCDVSSWASRPCFSWCLSCWLRPPRGAGYHPAWRHEEAGM